MKEECSEDDPLLRKHSSDPTTRSAIETVLEDVKTEVKVLRRKQKKILHQTIIRYPPVVFYNSGLGGG